MSGWFAVAVGALFCALAVAARRIDERKLLLAIASRYFHRPRNVRQAKRKLKMARWILGLADWVCVRAEGAVLELEEWIGE